MVLELSHSCCHELSGSQGQAPGPGASAAPGDIISNADSRAHSL